MNAIDRCVDYCATFDPAFPSAIRGASAEQLARLEAAAGRPCGDMHRRFLERMGNDAAWLGLGVLDTRIEGLIHSHETTPGGTPPGVELFAISTDEPYADAFLIHRGEETSVELHTTMEGAGYEGFREWALTPLAASLPSLLCLIPLERYTLDALPLQVLLSLTAAPAGVLDSVEATAVSRGFTPLWFSDRAARVLVRGTTWLVARQEEPGRSMRIRLASSDRPAMDDIAGALQTALPLQRDSTSGE